MQIDNHEIEVNEVQPSPVASKQKLFSATNKAILLVLLLIECVREIGTWGAYTTTNEVYLSMAHLGINLKMLLFFSGLIGFFLLVVIRLVLSFVPVSDEWVDAASGLMSNAGMLIFGVIVASTIGLIGAGATYGGAEDI